MKALNIFFIITIITSPFIVEAFSSGSGEMSLERLFRIISFQSAHAFGGLIILFPILYFLLRKQIFSSLPSKKQILLMFLISWIFSSVITILMTPAALEKLWGYTGTFTVPTVIVLSVFLVFRLAIKSNLDADQRKPMPTKKEIEDLERALSSQQKMTEDSLKNLGFNPEPQRNSGASGVFDLHSESEAADARRKLRTIEGTSVRGVGTQVIVEPEHLRQSIDQMAEAHGWPIEWYNVVQK
ncbi:MAG: hypothetical protein ABL930_10905 [Pseudobdellovibrio sp.]